MIGALMYGKNPRRKLKVGNNKQPDEEQERTDFFDLMLGDRIYDSDNEFDIPTLRTDRQPENGLLLPFAGWGADTRAKKGISTYHSTWRTTASQQYGKTRHWF